MGALDDARARWLSESGHATADEVIARLLAGRSLEGLPLGDHGGRVDLRGMPFPQPKRLRRFERDGWFIEELGERVHFKKIRLENLDLSLALLDAVRIWDATIDNCLFEGARCQRLGILRSEFRNCSFADADFRGAAVGGWDKGGSIYRDCSFVGADFRVGSCPAATFVDCDFSKARLEKIDFQSSSFIRCRFAGELREVMFYDHGFKTGKPDPNPMEGVDFSEAEFHDVEFRRLDLDRVLFPKDENHVVVHDYRCVLESGLAAVVTDASREGRKLKATFEHRLKWAGPHQEVGVFSVYDFQAHGGPAFAETAVRVLRNAEAGCAAS